MARRPSPAKTKTKTYVVYVRFPAGSREYSYLCDISGLRQGDHCIANGTRCEIIRTADYDPLATRFVHALPNQTDLRRAERRKEICRALRTIVDQQRELDLFTNAAKRSPEAKKLLTELKGLL